MASCCSRGRSFASDLDSDVAEARVELVLLPPEAADDHAPDAGLAEPPDLPCEQGPAADRDERLRQAAGRVAETLGLPAGEDDRLHR